MVRDGDFAGSDNFFDHHDIFRNSIRQCTHRNLIAAGVAPGGHALLPEAFCFCHERAHVTANAVSSEAADNGCHTELVQAFHRRLRGAVGKAALAASAEHVNMAVDKARCQDKSGSVYGLRAREQAVCRYRAGICDLDNFIIHSKNVFSSEVFRRIDVYVLK